MILKTGEVKVSVEPIKWERPEEESDWLMIKLKVETPFASWEAAEPAMLSWEGEQLADWLDALGNSEPVDLQLGFLKPHMNFYLEDKDEGAASFRLYLEESFRPEGSQRTEEESYDLYASFTLTLCELKEAAAQLREELAKFPIRTA